MSVAEPLRLVEERKISRKVSPVVSAAGIRLQSEGTSVGGAAATWKTAESPYMGRSLVGVAPALGLLMGPSCMVEEELGRPTRTMSLDEPSATDTGVDAANASVPSWSQPVRG